MLRSRSLGDPGLLFGDQGKTRVLGKGLTPLPLAARGRSGDGQHEHFLHRLRKFDLGFILHGMRMYIHGHVVHVHMYMLTVNGTFRAASQTQFCSARAMPAAMSPRHVCTVDCLRNSGRPASRPQRQLQLWQ